MIAKLAAAALALLALSFSGTSRAATSDTDTAPVPAPRRPAYDALRDVAPEKRAAAPAADLARDPRLLSGAKVHFEPRFGVPTFLWAAPPARTGLAKSAARGPVEAARGHLGRYASFYRLAATDVDRAEAAVTHRTGSGPVVVRFRQRIDGIEVFREELRVVMDRALDLVAIAGFIGPAPATSRGETAFALGAEAAIERARTDLARGGATLPLPGEAPRAERTWFHLPSGYVPAWYVEVAAAVPGSTDDERFAYVVAADDGRILFRHDQVADDSFAYRVFADDAPGFLPYDGPQGTDATPHPTGLPDHREPAFAAPRLVTLQNVPFSRNDPWLPAGATTTTGNNVDAYADLVAPSGFGAGDFRPTTSGVNAFDFAYDTSRAPDADALQRSAAVVQLFYVTNFFHDWFYDAGFDEAAGNAQLDNFGRGGLGNDRLRAEAQDYSGRNNANMFTPRDGSAPRMQMYVFDPEPHRYLRIPAPSPIAGDKRVGIAATWGPTAFDVTGELAYGAPADGCAVFTNPAAVAGRIAVVTSYDCDFVVKAQNAEAAGAIGVLIATTSTGRLVPYDMSGTSTSMLPAFYLAYPEAQAIRDQLDAGAAVTATMRRTPWTVRDGSIDNQIVAHEWGHFISSRLVGNANGLTTNHAAGLGEGWGDFHALLYTVRPEDVARPGNDRWQGVYALAGYASAGGGSPEPVNNGHYFGIRRVPYSTDFAKNPLTYRHIANGVALPAGVPIAFGLDGGANAEVHNAGEVWATMLWECYAALLRDAGPGGRLTFAEAQDRMKRYLVGAYKATPLVPTLLEARDALLAVARATDGRDFIAFAEAFARRGAGVHAVSPDRFSEDNAGVVESNVPATELAFVGATLVDDVRGCDADGALDGGETGTLTVTLRNVGLRDLSNSTVTVASSTPGVSFPAGATVNVDPVAVGEAVSASVQVRLAPAESVQELVFAITFDDVQGDNPVPATVAWSVRGNLDDRAAVSASDAVESATTAWASAGTPAEALWQRALEGGNGLWHGSDIDAVCDVTLTSPALLVGEGDFAVSFRHRYDFETYAGVAYDGGVVELSVDGGPWTDVGAAVAGYTGAVTTGQNPLATRSAYTGFNAEYPAFRTQELLFARDYAGRSVRLRFRIGCDEMFGAGGWDVDDVVVTGITNTPFSAVTVDPQSCDDDRDGLWDGEDCAPLDASAWALPSVARDVVLSGRGTTTLSWSAPVDGGSSAFVYDVLRSGSRDFAGAACAAPGLVARSWEDASAPAPGSLASYVVRVRNACGANAGARSDGTARAAAACP